MGKSKVVFGLCFLCLFLCKNVEAKDDGDCCFRFRTIDRQFILEGMETYKGKKKAIDQRRKEAEEDLYKEYAEIEKKKERYDYFQRRINKAKEGDYDYDEKTSMSVDEMHTESSKLKTDIEAFQAKAQASQNGLNETYNKMMEPVNKIIENAADEVSVMESNRLLKKDGHKFVVIILDENGKLCNSRGFLKANGVDVTDEVSEVVSKEEKNKKEEREKKARINVDKFLVGKDQEVDKKEKCPICSELFVDSEKKICKLNCEHLVHYNCLQKCVENDRRSNKSSKCSVCNKNIV